jgi:predicted dehydrogenase
MRFGLVGTRYWARATHGTELERHPDVDLFGVWGRDSEKTAAIAQELGTTAYSGYASLLADVDAIAFAIDSEVQARMAIDAARAGKHLLLDKPLTLSVADADELVAAVEQSGVSSVVFFTFRFAQISREWIAAMRERELRSGSIQFIVSIAGTPYANSPWRNARGALWDIGPHALSVLLGELGSVQRVTARPGADDLVHLILEHDSGATSVTSLTLMAPENSVHVSARCLRLGPSRIDRYRSHRHENARV